ncbi:coiled-coil domain-containing protein 42-like [Leptodactylus fuscus]|uniref:coiled-coil domain-containing protein 42-like n=1 Tax=Leptodactylus fuscus TaxID=238119 RepID=UPI003F4EBEC6
MDEQRRPHTLRLRAQSVQRALEAESAEFRTMMDGVALRWEELCTQKAELRDELMTFQHLIAENEMKRLQAVKKAKRAEEICNQKEEQLCRLLEEQQALGKRKQKIQTQIQQYSKFCDYLESSVATSEEVQFQVVGDVLSRFHTLVATSHYLHQVVQKAQESIDQTKGQLSCFLEEKSNEALQMDNQLGQLQTDLEEAQNQRLLWESHWTHIQNTAAKTTLLIGTIKMVTLNLFQCIAIQERNVAVDDTTRQLEMVQQHIQEISDIVEATRRKLINDVT